MPPMPPPGPPGIAGLCFFGTSATIASVVMSRPAMEAASCSAVRTTLVGSMMPFDTRLPYSPVCASRISNETANFGLAVGRDGADLGDLLVRGDFLGVLLEVSDNGLDRKIDAALEVHRVHAGGDSLGTFPDDRVRENGGCSRAVPGLVGGLR